MSFRKVVIHHLVKGEDLNHHGTIFAGRAAEWLVEAGFCATAYLMDPKDTVCMTINGMTFTKPAPKGRIIRYESRIIKAGTTSMIAYIQVFFAKSNDFIFDGFMTFVHLGEDGKKAPHGVKVVPTTDDEKAIVAIYEKTSNIRVRGIDRVME